MRTQRVPLIGRECQRAMGAILSWGCRMKNRRIAIFALAMGLALFCGPAVAHHGSQGYDFSRRVTLKGTVARFVWANPHCQIFLDAKDDKGAVTNWAVELNNPGNLIRLGWTHTIVKNGDEVSLEFNPGKDGKPVGICADVLFPDGRRLHSTQGCGGTLEPI
jgi:hypothetical protein